LFKFYNRAGFTVEFFDRQNIVFGDAVLRTWLLSAFGSPAGPVEQL
jgi:hypothetical protein